MQNEYPIWMENKAIGQAYIEKQGLYYKFRCRCILPREGVFRVTAQCGERFHNLGVLVPKDGEFCLETTVPVKKLGEGRMHFSIGEKQAQEDFVPISEGGSFSYLDKLHSAKFTCRDGVTGILIKKTALKGGLP